MAKLTKKEKILKYLLDGMRLSELKGLSLGLGTSFRSRISELRADGWKIEDEFVESPHSDAKFKEYFFTKEFLENYNQLQEVRERGFAEIIKAV